MVDLSLLQSVSYIAGALGVCVAAFYYVMNLRETLRNRRVTLATSLMQTFISEEGSKRFADIMSMKWISYEDFQSKYSSQTSPDNFAKRNAIWNTCEILGHQYKSGLVDMETLFAICNTAVAQCWVKFKPIIEEYRGKNFSSEHYRNFEFLAGEVAEYIGKRDSSYKGNPLYFEAGDWERAFAKG